MPYRHINHEGVELTIIYDVIPSESRNQGHPDSRLPDVPTELSIDEVMVTNYDPDWVSKLILEDIENERDSE
jgi:hypothetical protein